MLELTPREHEMMEALADRVATKVAKVIAIGFAAMMAVAAVIVLAYKLISG